MPGISITSSIAGVDQKKFFFFFGNLTARNEIAPGKLIFKVVIRKLQRLVHKLVSTEGMTLQFQVLFRRRFDVIVWEACPSDHPRWKTGGSH